MEHILGQHSEADFRHIGRMLVVISESNGRQFIGYVDGDAKSIRVGEVMVYDPLLVAEQQLSGGRINMAMAPIFHGMLVEEIMVQATSMCIVSETGRYRETYDTIQPRIAINIRAAEAGLIAPEQPAVDPNRPQHVK